MVTVTHKGYIKRVPLATYRAQRRGGKGRSGLNTRDEDFVTQIFIASTHTPVLFFSSRGMCYRMKVWRLPAGTPQSIGKALVNLLPLEQGEWISSILPLPEDTETYAELQLMFSTQSGNVRRNALGDFENINRNGKIAMKLEEGDRIIDVCVCRPSDNVLMTTAKGQCIRFPVEDVRVFKGRDSIGVRGIRLAEDDHLISMAILSPMDATPAERATYIKLAAAARRAQMGGEDEEEAPTASPEPEEEAETDATELSPERFNELAEREQFVFTVSERGFGKRSSSYEFRTSGRGGKGIVAMVANDRNGKLAASFPIEDSDQIMLVTNAGQIIRTTVDEVRIAGRNTQGVRIFRTDEDERVVSVERIRDVGENGDDGDGDGDSDGGDDAASVDGAVAASDATPAQTAGEASDDATTAPAPDGTASPTQSPEDEPDRED